MRPASECSIHVWIMSAGAGHTELPRPNRKCSQHHMSSGGKLIGNVVLLQQLQEDRFYRCQNLHDADSILESI